MRRVTVLLFAVVLCCPALGYSQAGTAAQSVEPFKLGTFSSVTASANAVPWVGLVLREKFVIALAQANTALEQSRSFPRRYVQGM